MVNPFQRLFPLVRALVVIAATALICAKNVQAAEWRTWDSFRQRFIQSDGRVVEFEANSRTTSEAQAYAMFFALVNNDRRLFDQLLRWTENNLAAGNLGEHLPGWLWGKDHGSRWRLLDDNPASDADLWLAYTLIEAGRLWQAPRYTGLGTLLLRQVRDKEVRVLPDATIILLPGLRGFQVNDRIWQVNPSYVMPQHLAAFALVDPDGPWRTLEASLPAMLLSCCPSGFAPDWVSYWTGLGWGNETLHGADGSYDAIRVYLWAGMMDDAHPGRDLLLNVLQGMRRWLREHDQVPEKIDTRSGKGSGRAPPGFTAAVLPYLSAHGDEALLVRQLERLRAAESGGLYGASHRYYDQVLVLFGLGYLEQRYRFDRCGRLQPAWTTAGATAC